MKHVKYAGTLARALLAALALCLLAAVAAAQSGTVEMVEKSLDVASRKDVVWLSLAVALGALGVIAYLIKVIVKMNTDSIRAIQELCAELKQRPCFKHFTPHE